MNPLPALSASDLSFSYGDMTVLEHLNFSVAAGEYIGIIGRNGGGKTTLLKIILGLLVPKEGNMAVFGQPPHLARKHGSIGYVPQRAGQGGRKFPATVLEIVRSGLTAVTSRTDANERVDHALRETDTYELRHRLIHELSGGQCQRVFIARSLVAGPKLLILDEPATGVDAPSRERFHALLTSLCRTRGMTILFVTHDIDSIAADVNRVLCINRTLCIHDSPKDFLEKHFLSNFLHAHA